MTITNGYQTLAEVKTRLGITDSTDDSRLETIIEAVSRAIDDMCGRRIYAAAETRYYTADKSNLLFVDDLLSVTTLQTDDTGTRIYSTTWAATDYDLMPYNTTPYQWIEIAPNGLNYFPVGIAKGVKITGSFGFASSTPKAVSEACALASMHLWGRKSAVFGVQGGAGFVQRVKERMLEDEAVASLLESYIRRW